MIFRCVFVIFRHACRAVIAVIMLVLIYVAARALVVMLQIGLCDYEQKMHGVAVDWDFSARIFHGDSKSFLDKVKYIHIHVVPSHYGWADCHSVFSENTKIASLTGKDATSFLSHAMAIMKDIGEIQRDGCYQNREDITYHILVGQKDPGVGYFIVRKCSSAEHDSSAIQFEYPGAPEWGITDAGMLSYSDELHSLLSLRAENAFP